MHKSIPKRKSKTADKINIIWGLVCSLSSTDLERNNISLFNVIDQLQIPKDFFAKQSQDSKKVIGLNHELVLVCRRLMPLEFCTNEVTTDLKITSVDPNGLVLGEILAPVVFKPGNRINRLKVQHNSFTITVPGEYFYKVQIVQAGEVQLSQIFEVPYLVTSVEI